MSSKKAWHISSKDKERVDGSKWGNEDKREERKGEGRIIW